MAHRQWEHMAAARPRQKEDGEGRLILQLSRGLQSRCCLQHVWTGAAMGLGFVSSIDARFTVRLKMLRSTVLQRSLSFFSSMRHGLCLNFGV